MPEKKYAQCRLQSLNGVSGFNLEINGSDYGHYPISQNHDAEDQIKMAIDDAKDYGYDGIIFTGE